MREIKFRAWDKQNKKIINNVPLNKNGKFSKCMSSGFALQYDPEYEEIDVMQYTGLKDRNGVDIYEGDIVVGDEGYVCKVKGIVGYYGMAFHFKGKREDGKEWFDTITSDWTEYSRIKVIGNIYETPELLKES